jgi:hypothetical protein
VKADLAKGQRYFEGSMKFMNTLTEVLDALTDRVKVSQGKAPGGQYYNWFGESPAPYSVTVSQTGCGILLLCHGATPQRSVFFVSV